MQTSGYSQILVTPVLQTQTFSARTYWLVHMVGITQRHDSIYSSAALGCEVNDLVLPTFEHWVLWGFVF